MMENIQNVIMFNARFFGVHLQYILQICLKSILKYNWNVFLNVKCFEVINQ